MARTKRKDNTMQAIVWTPRARAEVTGDIIAVLPDLLWHVDKEADRLFVLERMATIHAELCRIEADRVAKLEALLGASVNDPTADPTLDAKGAQA